MAYIFKRLEEYLYYNVFQSVNCIRTHISASQHQIIYVSAEIEKCEANMTFNVLSQSRCAQNVLVTSRSFFPQAPPRARAFALGLNRIQARGGFIYMLPVWSGAM
ncbi:unnamed protein product [Urochloa humidicola]